MRVPRPRVVEVANTWYMGLATAGGGARNPQWAALRSNLLGVDVVRAANSDAAFGAAVLALRG